MPIRHAAIVRKHSGLALSLFAVLLMGCTDDFSRFQFGQKNPAKPRDAGPQNMSDATGNGADGGAVGAVQATLPSALSAGSRADPR